MIQQGRPFSFVSKFVLITIDAKYRQHFDCFCQFQLTDWGIPLRADRCVLVNSINIAVSLVPEDGIAETWKPLKKDYLVKYCVFFLIYMFQNLSCKPHKEVKSPA